MGNRHVVHTERGWRVKKEGAQRPSATADTQAAAVQRAIEIVGNDGGGQVVVHDKNGEIRTTHDVEPGGTATTAQTAKVQADAAASKATGAAEDAAKQAEEKAGAAAEQVKAQSDSTADRVRAQAESAADRAADGARQLGATAGNRLGSTIRRMGGLVKQAGDTASGALEQTRKAIRRKGKGRG